MDLFDYVREQANEKESPLASRLRPTTLEEVVGQQHIIGKDKLLYRAIKADKIGSVIFYGPPGTGKTYNTVNYAVAIIENKSLEEVSSEDYFDVLERYNEYKKDRILERIAQTGNRAHFNQFSEPYKKTRAKYRQAPLKELEYQLRRVKYMDTLEALFYLFMELLKPSTPKPNYTPPLSPEMRQEIRKFEQYKKQFKLLHDENITTVPELEAFIGKLSKQIDDLDAERKAFDNKRRRAKTDEDKEMYLAEIRGISAQIKPIRDKLKIAKATLETIPKIEKLFDIEREMERKVIQKERSKER